ncbi:GGDEF domain-containing protein [Lacimicrobium alkaliphilum]|uniref:diguanylate cyclase n=1 Tax=Lacimicrobium alkaliphilum TaxID=1526571 RepID=A0A0U2Z628_9ALTE|nr:GGDEF domain-containing protein [Lacimicrobium alkaliphilum]ALS98355.1 hypothetical protein AT746_08870 [Lacimicrobium alkaliphilum]
MKTLIVTIALIIFATNSLAQEDYESLLIKADKIRSSSPSDLSKILKHIDPLKLTPKQLELFEYLSAYEISYSGDLVEGVKRYNIISSKYSASDSDIKYRAILSSVNNYALMHEWVSGLKSLEHLLGQLDKIRETEIVEQSLISASILYNQLGQHDLALKYSETLLSRNPSKRSSCFANGQKIEALVKSEEGTIGTNEFEDAIKECEEQGEKLISGIIKSYWVSFLIDSNKLEEAHTLALASLEQIKKTNYPPAIYDFYALLCKTEYSLRRSESAIESCLQASQNEEGTYLPPKIEAFHILSKIFSETGSYEKSLEYYKKYAEADKTYLDEVKVKQLAIQQAKHDAIEKANQIALLDKENTLLKTQARLSKEEQENNRLFMAFLMLVILMVVLWAYKNRRMHLKIRQQAETDDLTGISNRGHFSQVAESALSYHKKTHQPLAFVIFDLDLFKNVNDQFGHQVGDWALKAAVDALKRVCREQDQIGRMGGEEFAILLPGCSIGKAMQVAEACRLAIEAIDTSPSGEHFTLTASFGVADTQVCSYEFDQLYGCADHALYQSKENGRNRVYRYIQDTSANPLPTQQTQ